MDKDFKLVIHRMESGQPFFKDELLCPNCSYVFVTKWFEKPKCPRCGTKETPSEQ